MKNLTISLEGNSGAGKSTILSRLSESSMYDVVREPIDKWTNIKGHDLLALSYKDPRRWDFAFEAHVHMTMAEVHSQPTQAPIKMMERSIYSAHHCFSKHYYQRKVLQDIEYELLKKWFEILTANNSCKIDYIIYLRTTPETCLERVRTRNRSDAMETDLSLLLALHALHEEWLAPETGNNKTVSALTTPSQVVPVILIDANQNEDEVYADINQHVANLYSR